MGLFDKITSSLSSGDSSGHQGSDDAASEGQEFDPFSVPADMVEDKVNVTQRTEIISTHYDEINARQAKQIAEILEKHMTDPEGYSPREMRSEVEDELSFSSDFVERVVWNERASIEICDTVRTYREQSDEFDREDLYTITMTDDDRVHPVREEAHAEIDERGGVPLDELQDILREKAEKYRDEGGTPERMDHWIPHEKPRYTVMRKPPDF